MALYPCLRGILVLSLVYLVTGQDNYGVLYAEDSSPTKNGYYCMMYNPHFQSVPEELQQAEKFHVDDMTPSSLCEDLPNIPSFDGTAVAVSRGNCTFSEKARLVQKYGGKVVIIVSSVGLSEPIANSTSDYAEINITVSLMSQEDFTHVKEMGADVTVQLYGPKSPRMDYNLIVIWLMAVATVIAGSYWSGTLRHRQWLLKKKKSGGPSPGDGDDDVSPPDESEPETFDLSPTLVLVFVVMMCGMLVTLYFFYDYLVYVIIALFSLMSAAGVYSCVKPALNSLTCIGDCRIPANRLPLLKKRPEVRHIVLALICLSLGVWWLVERNKYYAWILQDILGIFFCIHMLKTIRLPNLMTCTVLLSLLFVYDIFFVFITPLFTTSGNSVMVEVATGGESTTGETLPMVLKVPRFASSAVSLCSMPYSLLGFGDILVPALLVSFCYGFDLKVGSKRVYFISTVIAYGVGLVLTFVALALMSQGQPALLYLVPCTLFTTLFVGWRRQELAHLWRGKLESESSDSAASTESKSGQKVGKQKVKKVPRKEANDDSEEPLLVNR